MTPNVAVHCIVALVAGGVLAVTAGCSPRAPSVAPPGEAEHPEISIRTDPAATEVVAGGEIAITAESDTTDELRFEWSADRGRLSRPEGQSVIFTAPEVPGLVIVDLRASGPSGMSTRSVTFTVVAIPTATVVLSAPPTGGSMDSDVVAPGVPAPGGDGAPTREPAVREGCDLVSSRPPISGPGLPGLSAAFSRPADCARGLPADGYVASGTVSGDLAGTELFLLVLASDQKWYPQSPDACAAAPADLPAAVQGGEWWSRLYLGRAGMPEQFDVVLVATEADGTASATFKQWLRDGCRTGQYPGLLRLPSGLTELASITVTSRG